MVKKWCYFLFVEIPRYFYTVQMNFAKLHSKVLELLDKYFNGLEMRSIKIKRIAESIFSQGPDIRLFQYDGGLHLQPSLPSSSIQNFHVISSSCGIILDASKDNDFFKHKNILHYRSPCKNININTSEQIHLRNTA